jgi:subtilisin family serine protease
MLKMAAKLAPVSKVGFVNPGIAEPKGPDYVIVEMRHDSRVAYSRAGFSAPAEAEPAARALNTILEKFHVKRVQSLFDMRERQIRQRVTAAPASLDEAVSAEFAHSGFVKVLPRRNQDAARLAKQLNDADVVWKAVVAPRPVPAAAAAGSSTASRNFEPAQGYLDSPPNGIGAIEAWQKHGSTGKGITICDIEGNWNFNHEDLPSFTHIGGMLVNDLGWRNHGTAVLGEMVSKPGRAGTVGISHGARAVVHSAFIDGVWNAAGAIAAATARLNAGDVILIELQATGPNGKYVAMQYWDANFSAIRAAVDKGICVVEAAGNGDENFDLPIFSGTGLQKDSGAIVVGAGIPPTNHFDYFGPDWGFPQYSWIGNPRSRIWFSNYGKIVNVQAWGWHVTSTGYGDAQGHASEDRWYTVRFSGTSSASPIVTGCVACIQGHAKASQGQPLSPAKVRSILMSTGTAQESGPGVPLSQRIGPQPNLIKALAAV